uniref:Mfs transporter n=1 Tax=Tetraselmis sp. GSL018 TaxID=582737 RepID=A0A061R1R6_9CHLO|mmetsp:Transcript_17981/g.43096  ORF Transcript_17981/g.43096 Transcript_17981/m.43096 type:complete len:554 (-) Transcript_17981:116-1777(-)
MLSKQLAPPETPSPTWRVVLVTVALLHVLTATGEAYGWTALRPVLFSSGLFDRFSAYDQTTKMNLVSTLGISANAMCKLPLGFLLDRFGPRLTAVTGSVLFLVGSLMMGFGDRQSVLQMALAYFLLGTSGPFIQMPCFQFTNLFPRHKATLISFMITAFELSTGVFFIFNLASARLGMERSELFGAYSLVGVFILLTSLFMWPDSPHVEPDGDDADTDASAGAGEAADPKPEGAAGEASGRGGGGVPLIDRPFWGQVLSWEFAYVTLFFSVHNFTQGVVLTTMGMQTAHYFPDRRTADSMADLFSIILPLGFLPMLFCTITGASGFILNRPQLAFFVVSLMSCTYGALFLFPSLPTYLVLFVMFPVARQFVFSTFISFSATTFGYKSFGVINGTASTFAGLAQLLQNALVALVADDRTAWTWEAMDLLMSLVPTVLLLPPLAHWAAALCRRAPAGTPEGSEAGDVVQPLLSESALRPPAPPEPLRASDGPVSHSIPVLGSSHQHHPVPHFGSLSLTYGPMPFVVGSVSSSVDHHDGFLHSGQPLPHHPQPDEA